MIASPPPVYPWPIGAGARYHPAARTAAVTAGRPVGSLRCGDDGRGFRVHVELFAHRRVAIVPRGVGVAASGCRYPLWTDAPTGVVHVEGSRRLRDLFAVWGQRLTRGGLLSFRGRVSVFVDGRRVRGEPGDVLLTKHRQIVVELGGYVAPHPRYLFPKGTG